jgi:hypothetical protein
MMERPKASKKEEVGEDGIVLKGSEVELYSSFNPMLYAHISGEPFAEFPSFSDAVDEFFSKFEQQRAVRDVDKAR